MKTAMRCTVWLNKNTFLQTYTGKDGSDGVMTFLLFEQIISYQWHYIPKKPNFHLSTTITRCCSRDTVICHELHSSVDFAFRSSRIGCYYCLIHLLRYNYGDFIKNNLCM